MWVTYSLEDRDPHYDACLGLFDDLLDRKRTVAVPALVVGEVIQVIRRETARDVAGERGTHAPDLQMAQEMADEAVAVFLRRLGILSDAGSISLLRPSNIAGQYPTLALRMLIRHKGSFGRHGKMGIIYRNLGILDMMHALAARDYGVGDFCTCDRQFRSLAGDPGFNAINFVIL